MSEISNLRFADDDLTTDVSLNVKRRIESDRANRFAGAINEPATAGGAASEFVPRPVPSLRLQPALEVADDADEYHVEDLLRYHDKDFLRNAYRLVLKRPPEAFGFGRYLEALRSGRVNKIDVLAGLRYSAEGAARATRIKGLRLPWLVRRAGRVPAFGYLLRLAIAILRLPRNAELQRQAEAYSLAQSERIAEHLNEVSRRLAAETERLAAHLAGSLEEQHLRQTRATEEQSRRADELAARADAAASYISDLASRLTATERHARAADAEKENLRSELSLLNQNLQHARMTLTLLERHAASAAAAPDPDANTGARSAADDGAGGIGDDAFYAAFTERFRGSSEEITARLRVHLPLLEDVPDGEIIDLGSGRGEWLELLREAGRAAYGVDTNRLMARDCAARGLRVVEQDALTHLRELPAASVAGVFGFHIVEHLAPRDLVRLVQEAARVLLPGGVVLFETPNPENVTVGSHLFYTDPTHRHPLPSHTLRFLLESCGFDQIESRDLHPRDAEKLPGGELDELTRRFNHLFYGPMDYSLSGRKPAADAAPTV